MCKVFWNTSSPVFSHEDGLFDPVLPHLGNELSCKMLLVIVISLKYIYMVIGSLTFVIAFEDIMKISSTIFSISNFSKGPKKAEFFVRFVESFVHPLHTLHSERQIQEFIARQDVSSYTCFW